MYCGTWKYNCDTDTISVFGAIFKTYRQNVNDTLKIFGVNISAVSADLSSAWNISRAFICMPSVADEQHTGSLLTDESTSC